MRVIRVYRQINSETLHLPELKSLIGKSVQIVVREEPAPSEWNWQPLIDAAGQDLIDPEVYKNFRDFDRSRNAPASP